MSNDGDDDGVRLRETSIGLTEERRRGGEGEGEGGEGKEEKEEKEEEDKQTER